MTKKKTLTQWQEKKIRGQTKAGWSQKKIARGLGIAKWRVAGFQKAKSIGKRRKGGFWDVVKITQEASLRPLSWKAARKKVYYQEIWAERRARRKGKMTKTFQEFWQDEYIKSLSQEEKEKLLRDEMEEYEFSSD